MNWWGHGLELTIHASQVYFMEAPVIIELPDGVRLIVLIEGRPLTCYCCRQKWHIKKKCFQNLQEEMKKVEEDQSMSESLTKVAEKTQESAK